MLKIFLKCLFILMNLMFAAVVMLSVVIWFRSFQVNDCFGFGDKNHGVIGVATGRGEVLIGVMPSRREGGLWYPYEGVVHSTDSPITFDGGRLPNYWGLNLGGSAVVGPERIPPRFWKTQLKFGGFAIQINRNYQLGSKQLGSINAHLFLIPLWFIILIGASPPGIGLVLFLLSRRYTKRKKNGLCPSCGYDLRGGTTTGRCPECGKPVPTAGKTSPGDSSPIATTA